MKKYCVPYSIAIKLKEKGFVEECFARYDCALTSKKDEQDVYSGSFGWKKGECNLNEGYFVNNSSSDYSNENWVSVGAPLYQQVVDWLCNRKNIKVFISYLSVSSAPKWHIMWQDKITSRYCELQLDSSMDDVIEKAIGLIDEAKIY